MEAQYKVVARSAQLLAKDSVHGGGIKGLSTITTTEAQLHQVCAMFANFYYIFTYITSIHKMKVNGNQTLSYYKGIRKQDIIGMAADESFGPFYTTFYQFRSLTASGHHSLTL